MAGPSHTPAVDPKSIGSLLDPECGIPFDVFFDLEDEADTRLGMIGGHKNILALKSSVFKAMFFGSLRETGDQIQIKATSMGALKISKQSDDYIFDEIHRRDALEDPEFED